MNQDSQPHEQPSLSRVIERNIRTMTNLSTQADEQRSLQERVADAITAFSGRMIFVYVHIAWFGGWILLNSGLFGLRPFDPFPFQLLTMIVSLEAIFLSTFVLISQNRSNQESARRADLNVQVSLLAEHEITRVLEMLDAIQATLGVDGDTASDLADLETDTRPEDVLAEIDRVHRKARQRENAHVARDAGAN